MTLQNTLLGIFGSSPLHPLRQHMEKVNECAESLRPFFEAVRQQDWQQVETIYHRIADLEHKADYIKKKIRLKLPKGLFMPVHRSDVLTLLIAQDKVANKAKDIAGIVLGRHLIIPESMHHLFDNLLNSSIETVRHANSAIFELEALIETGFQGNVVRIIHKLTSKLERSEKESDLQQISVRRAIFELEATMNPVEVIFLYKVIELTGELADKAQLISGQLQLITAR